MQWLHCSSCAGSHAAHQWKASQRELLFTLLRRVVEVVRAEWIVAAHAVRGVVVVNLFGAARDGIVNRNSSVTGQLDATAALVVRARKLAFFGVLHSGTHIAYPDTRVVEPGRGQRVRQELYIEQLVRSGVEAARVQGAIALGGEDVGQDGEDGGIKTELTLPRALRFDANELQLGPEEAALTTTEGWVERAKALMELLMSVPGVHLLRRMARGHAADSETGTAGAVSVVIVFASVDSARLFALALARHRQECGGGHQGKEGQHKRWGIDRLAQLKIFERVVGHVHPPKPSGGSEVADSAGLLFYRKFIAEKAPKADMTGFFTWCADVRAGKSAKYAAQAMEMGFLMDGRAAQRARRDAEKDPASPVHGRQTWHWRPEVADGGGAPSAARFRAGEPLSAISYMSLSVSFPRLKIHFGSHAHFL